MTSIAAAALVAGTLALASATSASALNVGTLSSPTGGGTMSSTASAGASRLVASATIPFNCSVTSFASLTNTGVFPLPATIGTIQFQFSTCIGPGGVIYHKSCTTTTSFEIFTGPFGGISTGRYSGVWCTITFTTLICTANLGGTIPVHYTNPTPSTVAVASAQVSGQSLTVSSSTCPGVLPNGPAQIGAPGVGPTSLVNLPFTLSGSPASQPFLS